MSNVYPVENLAHGGSNHEPWAQMSLSDGSKIRAHISFDASSGIPVVQVHTDRDIQVRLNDLHAVEMRDGRVL